MSYQSYCAAMRLDEMIELPQSALLVYLHLMHATNALGHNGTVNLSDDDLAKRTHLAKQTITNAKRLLQNQGFIHCERGKGGIKTRYRLVAYQKLDELGNELGEELGQDLGQDLGEQLGQASRAFSLTSTNIIKKPPPPPPPRTPERVLIGEEVGRLSAQLGEASRAIRQLETRLAYLESLPRRDAEALPQNLPRSLDAENLPRAAQVDALPQNLPRSLDAENLPRAAQVSDEDKALWAIIEDWENRPKFAALGGVGVSRLRNALQHYSYAEIKAAMDKAELANGAAKDSRYNAVSYEFFAAILEGRGPYHRKPKKPKPTEKKGASGNDGHEDSDYRLPERTGTEPWKRREQACSA